MMPRMSAELSECAQTGAMRRRRRLERSSGAARVIHAGVDVYRSTVVGSCNSGRPAEISAICTSRRPDAG
jgi:hypothetical protein